MLELSAVHAGYKRYAVIRDINLTIPEGSVSSIVGVNGAGKSTLMRTICGLVKPLSGKISWRGSNVSRISPESRVKLGIVYCPEGRGIFPNLTVAENLKVGAYARTSKKEVQSDLQQVLEFFPILQQRWNQTAGTLSGGEQQMLAIGRALMSKPSLLILDEPSMGLAPLIVKEIYERIKKIRENGTSILLAEQNVNIALDVSEKVYVLDHGRIVKEGTPEMIKADQSLRDTYLGIINQ